MKIPRRIKRGEIFYADLNPVVGSEQGGVRPVVIIQNDIGNRYSPTVIVAAVTSRPDKVRIPTHVPISDSGRGITKNSIVLLEKIRTIDRSRLRAYIGSLDNDEMQMLETALVVSVGMEK